MPDTINITIDGQNYTMSKATSGSYADGVIYHFFKVFTTTGTFTFNFTASDGTYIVFLGSWTVEVQLTNAPTLTDWAVEPAIGEYGITDFNFTVNYIDIDNDNPHYVRLVLDGVSYTMYKRYTDYDYTDGCIYYRIMTIEKEGILEFNFTACESTIISLPSPEPLSSYASSKLLAVPLPKLI